MQALAMCHTDTAGCKQQSLSESVTMHAPAAMKNATLETSCFMPSLPPKLGSSSSISARPMHCFRPESLRSSSLQPCTHERTARTQVFPAWLQLPFCVCKVHAVCVRHELHMLNAMLQTCMLVHRTPRRSHSLLGERLHPFVIVSRCLEACLHHLGPQFELVNGIGEDRVYCVEHVVHQHDRWVWVVEVLDGLGVNSKAWAEPWSAELIWHWW